MADLSAIASRPASPVGWPEQGGLRRSRLWPYLTADSLFAPLVTVPSFIWAVLLHFVDIQNAPAGAGPVFRLALLIGLHVFLFGFPWLARLWLFPRVPAERWSQVLAGALAVGAIARGLLLAWSLHEFGYSTRDDYLFRAVASFANMTIAVGLLWVASSMVRNYYEGRRKQLRERDQLLALQTEADERLHGFDEQAAERIRESILSALRLTSETDPVAAVSQLRVSIDEVVRPLSHFLNEQSGNWVAPAPTTDRHYRIDWWRVLRESADAAKFRPWLILLGLLWISSANTVLNHGAWAGAQSVLLGILVVIPSLTLARDLGLRLREHAGQLSRAAFFVVSAAVVGLAIGFASSVFLADSDVPLQYLYFSPWSTVVFALMVGVADSAQQEAETVRREIAATTAELRWALARTRELHRQHRRALAHTLHGRIQATLASAVLRLEKWQSEGQADPTRIAQLRHEILDTVAELDFHNATPEPFDVVLNRVRMNWEGAAVIHLQVEPQLRGALQLDPVCLTTVNDLVPELVFNSVKHGNADEITVSLVRVDRGVLLLEVVDNGGRGLQPSGRGMGTQLLEDCAISWTRGRRDGQTTTVAWLPFQPEVAR